MLDSIPAASPNNHNICQFLLDFEMDLEGDTHAIDSVFWVWVEEIIFYIIDLLIGVRFSLNVETIYWSVVFIFLEHFISISVFVFFSSVSLFGGNENESFVNNLETTGNTVLRIDQDCCCRPHHSPHSDCPKKDMFSFSVFFLLILFLSILRLSVNLCNNKSYSIINPNQV